MSPARPTALTRRYPTPIFSVRQMNCPRGVIKTMAIAATPWDRFIVDVILDGKPPMCWGAARMWMNAQLNLQKNTAKAATQPAAIPMAHSLAFGESPPLICDTMTPRLTPNTYALWRNQSPEVIEHAPD